MTVSLEDHEGVFAVRACCCVCVCMRAGSDVRLVRLHMRVLGYVLACVLFVCCLCVVCVRFVR